MVKKSAQAGSKTEQTPNPISRLAQYIEDSRGELRKVTWPTLKETRKATFAVLGLKHCIWLLRGYSVARLILSSPVARKT